jgi:DNA-binding transcriptional LysR family regulator
MLSLPRLRILREVALRGSFTAAADALDYTQSTVSQAIAKLEAETGTRLVERDRGGVRLTAPGEVLVSHADGLLVRMEAAEADLAAVLGVRGGLLRMASFPTAGATLMPQAIARFRAAHPDVELTLGEGEPHEIAPRLGDGDFDLALLFEFPGDRLGPVSPTELFDDPLHVVLPAGHGLAERAVLRLEDLRDEAWVQTSSSSPCARHVVQSCHAAGFQPTVSFESDDYQTVQGLVAAGVGVALIPQLALSSPRDGIVVRALHPTAPARRITAATPRGAAVAPAAAAMLAILRDVAGIYGGDTARLAAGVHTRGGSVTRRAAGSPRAAA